MKYVALSGETYVIFQLSTMPGMLFAIGLILTVVALVLPGCRLRKRSHEQWRIVALMVPLGVLPTVLVWQQWEAALLSALLLVGLFVALFARRYPLRCILVVLMVGISLCIALLVDELNIGMRAAMTVGGELARVGRLG